MNGRKWLSPFALGLVALLAVGCGGDDDEGGTSTSPTASEGTGGGSSAPALDDKTGANTAITQANAVAAWAALSAPISRAAQAGAGGSKSINGANSGKATIQGSGTDLTLTFDNYSDDGKTWVAGTITYKFQGTQILTKGKLQVAGAYKGNLELDITTNTNPPGVSGTIKADDQTITLG
jgi:hypothetical protein